MTWGNEAIFEAQTCQASNLCVCLSDSLHVVLHNKDIEHRSQASIGESGRIWARNDVRFPKCVDAAVESKKVSDSTICCKNSITPSVAMSKSCRVDRTAKLNNAP